MIPRLALVIAASGLALGASACGEKEETLGPPGTEVLGTWQGELRQKGMKPFEVFTDIRTLDPGPQNRVRYSGLDCRGTWSYEGRGGGGYRFREVIDSGRSAKCKGAGEVTLTPSGRKLDYVFRGGGVESAGVLSRR